MKVCIPSDILKNFDKKSDKGHDHDNRYVMKGDMENEIESIWSKLKDLEENGGVGGREPVSITNFTSTPPAGIYEIGTELTNISFQWDVDKTIVSATLTDCEVSDDLTRAYYNYPLSTDKTFTLTVNDGKKESSKSLSFQFFYKCYYGVCSSFDNLDIIKNFIENGDSTLKDSNKEFTFTVPSGYGFVYYCYPKVWGDLYETSFYINGFAGGFYKSYSFKINDIDYILWRSNQLLTCTDLRVEIK